MTSDEGKVDANDIAAELGPEGLASETERLSSAAIAEKLKAFPTVADLFAKHHGRMRAPVVHGLLRQGEVMNLIAPPKKGKTWLTYHLGCAVAVGDYFLGYKEWKCEQGPVVIIDNELHPETISHRFPRVREALGYPPELEQQVRVINLRGVMTDEKGENGKNRRRMVNIFNMQKIITEIAALRPSLVIMDALYRLLPPGVSENDNSAMTEIYNWLDMYASWIRTAGIVVVHHTSKGEQGDKDLTDIGAGAGASSRACDNHMVLRPHDEEKTFILQYVARTWGEGAVTCKWNFPIWEACDADPSKVRGRKIVKDKEPAPLPHGDAVELLGVLTDDWQSQHNIEAILRQKNSYTNRQARKFIEDIKSKHGLYTLGREDGVKVCGDFEAMKEAALLFRRKARG